jgi:aspartyl-tRNA(Asn)/glutamyl-tRNA(Gln) amidotransferase subunit A
MQGHTPTPPTASPCDLTACELLDGYRSRKLSPVEVVDAVLDRIARVNPSVNAYVLVAADQAREQARASEQRWSRGEPFGLVDGVPTSIKDLLLTRGLPTRRGSRLVPADQDWREDAPSVARLREHGAVLIGKTTTPELGWKGVTDSPVAGATGNAWDPTSTAGGSSGGSATAVALGMGPLSVGTDGGGSVRIPAAFSGIVALKPTYGRIPLYPSSPFGTLAHAGPMTRTVADAGLMMDVLCQPDARDWSASAPPSTSLREGLEDGVRGLRVAYSPTLGYVEVAADVRELVDRAVEQLERLGAVVDQVDPGFADPVEAFHTLWFAGAAKSAEQFPRARWSELDPGLHEVVEEGCGLTASEYLDATAVRMALGTLMGHFHQSYDVLVTPTLPLVAFAAGHEVPIGSSWRRWTGWTPFTYPFNLTQQPAASVPCGLTGAGLPAGLQVVGPRHADALVLRVCAAYEAARGPLPCPPLLAAPR